MNLSGYLATASYSTPEQFYAVKDVINSAQTRITFWGARVIEIPGYSGSYYLGTLALGLTVVQNELLKTRGLYSATIGAQRELANKIINLYRASDEQLRNANFFSRTLNKVRESTFNFFLTILLGRHLGSWPLVGEREFANRMITHLEVAEETHRLQNT